MHSRKGPTRVTATLVFSQADGSATAIFVTPIVCAVITIVRDTARRLCVGVISRQLRSRSRSREGGFKRYGDVTTVDHPTTGDIALSADSGDVNGRFQRDVDKRSGDVN